MSFISLLGRGATVTVWASSGMADASPFSIGPKPTARTVAGKPGVYAYSVHVERGPSVELAEGGSAPRIIVADP